MYTRCLYIAWYHVEHRPYIALATALLKVLVVLVVVVKVMVVVAAVVIIDYFSMYTGAIIGNYECNKILYTLR